MFRFIKNLYINARLKHYKYVHILNNDKFCKPFVDFINRSFSPDEHIFLCKKRHNNIISPFPDSKNVIKINKIRGIKLELPNLQKLIFHSLFDGEAINLLYKKPQLLQKSYWMIWGGDLYNAPRNEKNDFVRRNIKAVITDVDGDEKVAAQIYGSKHQIFNAGYTFPLTLEMLDAASKEKHNYLQIQINNSCDKSTLDMLEILSRFKDNNLRITTVLSYGNMQYKDEIIAKGKHIFGARFSYLDCLISDWDYARYLAQNDILILNQDRQQGLGNSMATLVLGGKVFIKSSVTTFHHFNNMGVRIFDTLDIKTMTFDELKDYPAAIKKTNMSKSRIFFHDNYLKEKWAKVFKG